MENALITMQEDGVDDESIGALFRAMHTIKGTAGMFGFDDVVGFAHIAENLLSDVRDGKIELTEEMIDIFLSAKDHTQILVDLAVDNEPLDTQTRSKNNELLQILKSMLPDSPNDTQKIDAQIIESDVSGEKLWHISIRLKPKFFSSGMDILSILNFFNILGNP
jgi:two-component system chemotaxis sensor kinase CheA